MKRTRFQKIVSLVLVLCMLLSFCAVLSSCKKNKNKGSSENELTIRYYNDELYRQYAFDERIIIKQTTPHSLRFIRTK